MKKAFFAGMILIVFTGAFAQEFKIIGGGTLSRYSHWPAMAWFTSSGGGSEPDYKPGFLAGGGIEFALDKHLGFEVDVLYFQKGSRFDFSDALYSRKMDFSMNVLSFPALLKVKILRRTTPYLLAGGEYSIILSHRSRLTADGRAADFADEKGNTRRFDFGLVAGGGFEIHLTSVSFFVEGRFHVGARDVSNNVAYFAYLKTSSKSILFGLKI